MLQRHVSAVHISYATKANQIFALRLVYPHTVLWYLPHTFVTVFPARLLLLNCLTVLMEAVHSFETSVAVHRSTLYKVPEYLNLILLTSYKY
jgi:hypothetical protein